jgi:hypothetical protein
MIDVIKGVEAVEELPIYIPAALSCNWGLSNLVVHLGNYHAKIRGNQLKDFVVSQCIDAANCVNSILSNFDLFGW